MVERDHCLMLLRTHLYSTIRVPLSVLLMVNMYTTKSVPDTSCDVVSTCDTR